MVSSVLNFVDNLAENVHKIKCQISNCSIKCESVHDNLIKHKCLFFKKKLSKVDEQLKKRFRNTFNLDKNDINVFI